MNYDLEFILNSFLSREEMKDLSRKLSQIPSLDNGELVRAICLREETAVGIEKTMFNNLLLSFLDSTWDEYDVEMVRLKLNIPDSKTKTDILVKIIDGLSRTPS
jgi:hypothetical protein